MSITAEVFYVKDVLAAGDAVFGLLFTSWALGMVAGAVGLARRVPTSALAVAALAAVAIQGAGLATAAGGDAVGRVRWASRSAASPTASRTCSSAR